MVYSRTIAETVLLNKHEIKRAVDEERLISSLPLIDSENPKYIDTIAGNELRVLKNYPAAFDFVVNIIAKVHHKASKEGIDVGKYIKDRGDFYQMRIYEPTWKTYFRRCGNHTIRQSLSRQVFKEMQTGFVMVKRTDKHGCYIFRQAPFRIMTSKTYEGNDPALSWMNYRDLYLSKIVFGSLITGECLENGGDGFIEIPETFYPLLTGPDLGKLGSYNPVYKLNIHGLMKNTHKLDRAEVDRQELLEAIVPEYLDKNGNLKIAANDLHESLRSNMRDALEKIPSGLLVRNFYLGEKGDSAFLYFRSKGYYADF